MSSFDKAKNAVKSEAASVSSSSSTIKKVQWTNHGYKHVAPKNLSWKDIVRSTKHGDAMYKPKINIEKLERFGWENGTPTTNGKAWKVLDNKMIIGASEGIETQYMRIECSSNTIHGHPITFEEYKQLIK